MKKRKHPLTALTILLSLFISLLAPFESKETYQGATSYTNAKEFYESTALHGESYHVEMINGIIYYATRAKLATSSSSLRYYTVGFDITLSGNAHAVTFTVQRNGGSMIQLDSQNDGTHEYILYAILDQTLYNLANAANPAAAAHVLSAPVINVKMDAILTTRRGEAPDGGITENGTGGFTHWGSIYRLADSNALAALKDIFTGHKFESYINIYERLPNHLLQIRYNAQGLTDSSTIATAENKEKNLSIVNEFVAINGLPFIQNQRILQQSQLINPASIQLQKEGYHLETGKEWITADGREFNTSLTYMPKDILPLVAVQDAGITMYANWKANTYTINYDANGGTGSILPTDFTFDQSQALCQNTFTKNGYTLKKGEEWNTKPDGTGKSYSSLETVKNLTSKNGESLTLYANWEPMIVTITLDKQGGSNGSNTIYEKYATGFYSNPNCSSLLSAVTIPTKTGHTFAGYYSALLGCGKQIINNNGIMQVNNTYYTQNETIYAHFTPNTYTIAFDKAGGKLGTSTATATYGESFPNASAPIRSGYTFKGYYTQPEGKGTQHYNENMASDDKYTLAKNLTLYAHWIDETPPTITLRSNSDGWVNKKITLTADAADSGSGLKNIYIYKVASNGTLSQVAANTTCNGASSITLTYPNPTEGIVRYKAVATDISGKTAEAYHTVYYDITAPKGEEVTKTINGSSVFFKINVTDVKVN